MSDRSAHPDRRYAFDHSARHAYTSLATTPAFCGPASEDGGHVTLTKKTLNKPDETRPFEVKGNLAVVTIGDTTVGRGTFEPGWKWSTNVKPIAGTDSCQANHTAYVVSGRMIVKANDGTKVE